MLRIQDAVATKAAGRRFAVPGMDGLQRETRLHALTHELA